MKTKSPLAYDDLVYNDFAPLAKKFQSAHPFPHVVINDFLNIELARAIEKEFPQMDDERWYKYNNAIENKKALNNWEIFGPLTYNLMTYLNSPVFVSKLQVLLGDIVLYPDYGLNGGGYHLHKSGGKLNVHLDYSIHPKIHLERRINIILYLTEGWNEAWGGHISLWTHDEENHQPKEMIEKVAPLFNRAIIFDTTCNSWHGLPESITCPEDQARKSLAIYYLSPPNVNAPDRGKALFAPFGDQKDDQGVLDLIEKRSNVKTADKVWKKS